MRPAILLGVPARGERGAGPGRHLNGPGGRPSPPGATVDGGRRGLRQVRAPSVGCACPLTTDNRDSAATTQTRCR